MKEVTSSQNLVSMANTLRCVDGDTDTANNMDTELWLVQVPLGFQVSALNHVDASVLDVSGGKQTLKVKTEQENKVCYSVTAFRDADEFQKMSTVVTDTGGQICLGGKVKNMLMVTETAQHYTWHADHTLPAPKTPVPMPAGLKVRYTPFGAGTPCPSVCGQTRKRKKHASKAGKSAGELEDAGQDSISRKRKRESSPDSCHEPSLKKKKNKRKRESSPDDCAEPSPKKKKNPKKRESSPDSCAEPSPKKKKNKKNRESSPDSCHDSSSKKKKNKKHEASPDACAEPSPKKKKNRHSLSQSMNSQPEDVESPERTTASGKSRSTNSLADSQMFVIDTTGDPSLTAGDELQNHLPGTNGNTKHKKSKKEKKHRKTM